MVFSLEDNSYSIRPTESNVGSYTININLIDVFDALNSYSFVVKVNQPVWKKKGMSVDDTRAKLRILSISNLGIMTIDVIAD